MQRESRTSGELLLPVSRRPSHWEMISQRNNGAPSRISNRISPGWFTWQTVARLLCSWILTHTMPWRHLLIEIAPSQFIKGDQTDHVSHKLSEKLHKLGPCQRLLTTKSDLTQMTTYFSRWTLTPSLFFSWWTFTQSLFLMVNSNWQKAISPNDVFSNLLAWRPHGTSSFYWTWCSPQLPPQQSASQVSLQWTT